MILWDMVASAAIFTLILIVGLVVAVKKTINSRWNFVWVIFMAFWVFGLLQALQNTTFIE